MLALSGKDLQGKLIAGTPGPPREFITSSKEAFHEFSQGPCDPALQHVCYNHLTF